MKLHSKYHVVLLVPALLSVPTYPMAGWGKWFQDKRNQAWSNSAALANGAKAVANTVCQYTQKNPGTVLTAAGLTTAAGALGYCMYNALSANQNALPTFDEVIGSKQELSAENAIPSANIFHATDSQVYLPNKDKVIADSAYEAELAQEILNPKKIEQTPIVAPVVKPAVKPQVRMRSFQEVIEEGLKAEDVDTVLLKKLLPNPNKIVTTQEDEKLDAELVQQILGRGAKEVLQPDIAAPVINLENNVAISAPVCGTEIKTEELGAALQAEFSVQEKMVKKDVDQKMFKKHKQSSIDPMDIFLEEMRPVAAAQITVPAVKQPVVVKTPVAPVVKSAAKPTAQKIVTFKEPVKPTVKQPVVTVAKPAPVAKQEPKKVITVAAVAVARKVHGENSALQEFLKQDGDGNTSLHRAILSDNKEEAKAIIAKLNGMDASAYVEVVYSKENKNRHTAHTLIGNKQGRDYRAWTGIVTYVPVSK